VAFCEASEPGRAYTLEEIGAVMGCTRERVRQIEMRALRTVRRRLQIEMKNNGISESEFFSVFEQVFHRGSAMTPFPWS